MLEKIFDRKLIVTRKNRASKNWEKHNFVYLKYSDILFEKITEINSYFKKILLITSDSFETYTKISKLRYEKLTILSEYNKLLKKIPNDNIKSQKIHAYLEDIPLTNSKFKLIICNFCLHNINEKDTYIKKLYNLLDKDGLLLCNFFGEKNLYELRDSFIKTDELVYKGAFTRLPPILRMIDISNLFIQSGFKEVVSDLVNFDVYYNNVFHLLKDIKGTGENSSLKQEKKSITKKYLNILNKIYLESYSNNDRKIKATCNIISLSMWKEKK